MKNWFDPLPSSKIDELQSEIRKLREENERLKAVIEDGHKSAQVSGHTGVQLSLYWQDCVSAWDPGTQ